MRNRDVPRGLRNNNPGNIRRSNDKWVGLREVQTDDAFFQFKVNEYGYRAMIRILQNYQFKYGLRTVREVISRWAPGCENDTGAYVRDVCRRMGVKADEAVDLRDKHTVVALAMAISWHENGVEPVEREVNKGYDLT